MQNQEPPSVAIIGSIFRLRRDLVPHIKRGVISGSGLTLEISDLLLDLFGACELDWADPAADEQGFVTFTALKKSLVHGALLTRRLTELQESNLVEIRTAEFALNKRDHPDRRTKKVRITASGIKRIRPVYERYCRFCDELLADVSQEDRATLARINEALITKLRERR